MRESEGIKEKMKHTIHCMYIIIKFTVVYLPCIPHLS